VNERGEKRLRDPAVVRLEEEEEALLDAAEVALVQEALERGDNVAARLGDAPFAREREARRPADARVLGSDLERRDEALRRHGAGRRLLPRAREGPREVGRAEERERPGRRRPEAVPRARLLERGDQMVEALARRVRPPGRRLERRRRVLGGPGVVGAVCGARPAGRDRREEVRG
jgi:hypothetical protein